MGICKTADLYWHPCTELPASGNRKDREGDVGRTRVDERERRQRKCWDTEKRWEHVWLYLVVF